MILHFLRCPVTLPSLFYPASLDYLLNIFSCSHFVLLNSAYQHLCESRSVFSVCPRYC